MWWYDDATLTMEFWTKWNSIHIITHWCLVIIGSCNGLVPFQHQTITWIIADLSIEPLGTNFNEFWIKLHTFSSRKMHLKMSSAKCRPFYSGFIALNIQEYLIGCVQLGRKYGWQNRQVVGVFTKILFAPRPVSFTEMEMLSFWWKFHHWWHQKLSQWQLLVPPVMKILLKWAETCGAASNGNYVKTIFPFWWMKLMEVWNVFLFPWWNI